MAGSLFDVFVVGTTDASPAKLVAALSARLKVPAEAVTKGLGERRLSVGKGLPQAQAQELVRELKAMGAATVVRPTGATPPATNATPAPPTVVRAPMVQPPPRDMFGPPPVSVTASSSSITLAALGRDGSGAHDPFGPPPSAPNLDLSLGEAAPVTPAPLVGRDPFTGSIDDDPRLELDMSSRGSGKNSRSSETGNRDADSSSGSSDSSSRSSDSSSRSSMDKMRRSSGTSLPGASAMNLNKMAASSSSSGLAVDKTAAAEAYRTHCTKHGLTYDSRKASGCSKCLERGRKLSAQMASRETSFRLGDFGDNAAKRAFIGLALALIVGFIPAAYHALRVGARDIHRLRGEQEVLSRKPATEEITREFVELDATVDKAAGRARRTTGVLWILVAGGALVGWYRIT